MTIPEMVTFPHVLSAFGRRIRQPGWCRRLLLVGVLMAGSACDALEHRGNSESGYFTVVPAAKLATGGWLPMTVRDYEVLGSQVAEIGFALRDPAPDASVVTVRPSNGRGELVLDAVGDGDTVLNFNAKADGKARDDEYPLSVRTATRVMLSTCGSAGVFIRGMDAPISYQLYSAQSEPVEGLGLYPVEVIPAEAAELLPAASDLDRWVFHVADTAPARATLRSTLPNDNDLASVTMTFVDKSAVDRIPASPGTGDDTPAHARPVDVIPYAGSSPVCNPLRKRVVSLTPKICLLRIGSKNLDRIDDTLLDSPEVSFVAQGACRLLVTFIELGLELALPDITVNPTPPSSGSSHGGHDWDD